MRPTASFTILVLLAFGCGRREEPAARETAGAEGKAGQQAHGADDQHGAEDAGGVHIDHEMLRDLRITTAAVETRPGAEAAPVLGELRVPDPAYAEVGSPVTARALRVAVTAGETVKRGQLLAELQSLDLGKTRGEHQQALARAELARQAVERKRGLAEERIVPLREVQEAEAELRSAEAALASSRASLEAMGVSGTGEQDATLRLQAPLSGTVIERDLAQGQVVEPTHTLFRIGSLSTLWLIAHAPERDAVRISPRATARVVIPAFPGQTLQARVVLVGSQVEMASRTVPVRLELPNPGGSLKPGMSATVWLPVGEGASVLAVPAAALQRLGDQWCVFVPTGDDTFEARPVGRGRDLGGETEILSGVEEGETVVVEGAFLLKAEAEKARGEGAGHEHD